MKKSVDKERGRRYNTKAVASERREAPWKLYSANNKQASQFKIRKNRERQQRKLNWDDQAKEKCEQRYGSTDQRLNSRVWSWLRTNAGGVPNTCKSNGARDFGPLLSGERVSNAWATYLCEGDNTRKRVLIPHKTTLSHDRGVKGAIRAERGSRPIR